VLTAAAVCVLTGLLATPDNLGHRAHLVKMVKLATVAMMVSPATLVIQVHQVPLENLAPPVNQASPDRLALMEPQEGRGRLDHLVLMDHWDQRDPMGSQVTMGIAGTTVQTDHLDRLATKALLANKAVLDNRDHQADLEKMLNTAHALVVLPNLTDSRRYKYVDERSTHNVDRNKILFPTSLVYDVLNTFNLLRLHSVTSMQ